MFEILPFDTIFEIMNWLDIINLINFTYCCKRFRRILILRQNELKSKLHELGFIVKENYYIRNILINKEFYFDKNQNKLSLINLPAKENIVFMTIVAYTHRTVFYVHDLEDNFEETVPFGVRYEHNMENAEFVLNALVLSLTKIHYKMIIGLIINHKVLSLVDYSVWKKEEIESKPLVVKVLEMFSEECRIQKLDIPFINLHELISNRKNDNSIQSYYDYLKGIDYFSDVIFYSSLTCSYHKVLDHERQISEKKGDINYSEPIFYHRLDNYIKQLIQ